MITLLLIFPFSLFGQQPLNFDFEKKSVETSRQWGWASTSWGTSYFKIDSSILKQGHYSLQVLCSEDCTEESYYFAIETYELKSKNVTFVGYVKGKGLKTPISISAQYFYADKDSGEHLDEEIFSDELSGTFDWTELSVHLDIPASVSNVSLMLNYGGEGSAWFDDFEMLIEGKSVGEVDVAMEFSKENIEWLTDNTIPFISPLPVSSENELLNEDLSFFKQSVGDSRIIGLGESTHGTSEFFALKHKLLQYAVTDLGFRLFAIEDHQVIVQKIDRYIKSGEGDKESYMGGMFGVWQRQEVILLIEWLRTYNVEHPNDMVSFIGMDIQSVVPSIDSLSTFLNRQDLQFYEELEPKLQDLKQKAAERFMIRDTLIKLKWYEESASLYAKVYSQKEEWLRKAVTKKDTTDILFGIQYANLVQQFFQEVIHNGVELYRDEAMAENLSWYLENIYPNTRMVIWAHDVHVSRGDHSEIANNMHNSISMGSFLSKKYKDDYKSYGISTYSGTYRAFKTYSYQSLIESPLFESPKGSLEEALHQVSVLKDKQNLFLPLPRTEEWLANPIPVRFANHVSFDYGYWTRFSIPYQFDAMFFIDETSSARDIVE